MTRPKKPYLSTPEHKLPSHKIFFLQDQRTSITWALPLTTLLKICLILFKLIIQSTKPRPARPTVQDHVVFNMKSRWKPNLPALSDVKRLLQNQLLIISNHQQSCWRVERGVKFPPKINLVSSICLDSMQESMFDVVGSLFQYSWFVIFSPGILNRMALEF